MGTSPLRVALPRGRLYDVTVGIISRSKVQFLPPPADSRKLVFEQGENTWFLVKPSDIPFYIEHGAADLGIVGSDTLAESQADVMDLLDLRYGRCKMVLASVQGTPPHDPKKVPFMRVATQYPNVTRAHFRRKGLNVEVIGLTGAVELAPLTGLAHRIVDIVETGKSLADNKLVEEEVLFHVTARLITNRTSYKLRRAQMAPVVEKLRATVNDPAFVPK